MPNTVNKGLPATGDIRNRIGQIRLEKGQWNAKGVKDFYLVAWDFAVPCDYEKCVVYDRCTYLEKWTMREGKEGLGKAGRTDKCVMQMRYLRNVMTAFVGKMKQTQKNEQEDIIKFGFSLLPLYAQLFKFKLYEFGNNDVMVYSARGDSKINPVYKEIREIIKTIHGVWRDIGAGIKMEKNPTEIGDGAFIDALYCVGEDDKQREEAPDSGSGIQFSEEDAEEVSEKGTGLDIEIPDEKPKKADRRKRKKKRKKVKKEPVVVLSPLQKIRRRNKEAKEALARELEIVENTDE